MMAKKFAELQARMTPESRANVEQLYQKHLKEMPLHQLRKAQELSQETLAKTLHINQATIRRRIRSGSRSFSTVPDDRALSVQSDSGCHWNCRR
jgi:ribosome-binding protein aMBF1 (putative translation factor)